jgi:thiol-disulfide isomerase/thioredoxin
MTLSLPLSKPDLIRSIVHRLAGEQPSLPVEGKLASFAGATGWLNSAPLTPEGLRGRVVLVDFWTSTCVNWIRTLPYVRAWAAKYADAGLTVVGVHTPEFGFERDVDNVVAQASALNVTYPIALDTDYTVWRAFANHYWPAVYLADVDGRIRFHHFGEGEYAATEMAIQQLLLDAGADEIDQNLVMVDPRGLEVAADWQALRSPETYTGAIGRAPASRRKSSGSTSPPSTPRPPGSPSTSGDSRGRGPWPSTPRWRTSPAGASPSGSRRATSTSSWDRYPLERRSPSESSWTVGPRTARTGPMSAPTAAGSPPASAPTN